MRAYVASAIPLISASQLSLFGECQRKFAFRYIAKSQTPQHPAAALGSEVDDTQLQPYLRDGRPFDFSRESGYIAAAGLGFLPEPRTPGMEVQKHFILPSPASKGQFAYQGYMDLWLPDSKPVPDMRGGAPFVGDFKTTADLKWAKKEEALRGDNQAMLYATDALYETGADAVDLSWMYFQTKGARRVKRTYFRINDYDVIEQFKKIEETALELFDVKQSVTDPLSLPPTPSQCGAYGGCPFRDKCNLSPADHLAALAARDSAFQNKDIDMNSGTSSLLANLKAKKAGAQASQASGMVPAPTVVSVHTPAPSPSPSLEEHVASNPRAAFLTASTSAPAPLGINPPEKDLVAPAATVVTQAVTAKRGRPKKVPPFDPVGADVAAATGVDPRQLPLPLASVVIPGPALPTIDYDKLAEVVLEKIASRLGVK